MGYLIESLKSHIICVCYSNRIKLNLKLKYWQNQYSYKMHNILGTENTKCYEY